MVNTMSLNEEIEKYLLDNGALKVGFATKESMAGGPPSADITYPLPEAQSAVCFAVPLDKGKIRPFLRKDLPNGRIEHEIDNVKAYLKAFKISNEVVRMLGEKGHAAQALFPNFKYREDVPFWGLQSFPPVSLRYLAVRSGAAIYGWSGNVGLKGHGATIILGGLVTSAKLTPTDPIPPSETFCNECKLCEKACTLRMFGGENESVSLGGQEFSFTKRRHLMRCFAGCGGYSGLDKSGKWSTWSPGRYSYPETNEDAVRVLAQSFRLKRKWYIKDEKKGYNVSDLQKDAGLTEEEYETLLEGNEKGLKNLKNVTLTCGNCQLICWGDPIETAENYKILTNSGCAVQKKNREIVVLPPDEAEELFLALGNKNRKGFGGKVVSWIAYKYLKRANKYFQRG